MVSRTSTIFIQNLKSQKWKKSGTLLGTNYHVVLLGNEIYTPAQTEEESMSQAFEKKVTAGEMRARFADKIKSENKDGTKDDAITYTLHELPSDKNGKPDSIDDEGTEVEIRLPFKLHKLDCGPETIVKVTKGEAVRYYTQMQTIRRIETATGNLYREKVIRGFCHLSTGQEACAVGMKAAMRDVDNIIGAYRVHGWCYLMGITPVGLLAELTGRQSGCACGKGGSVHVYSPNFYGGNGIVGTPVPLGAGVSLACKYKGNGAICLALYGDGAANQGQVSETFIMAHLWKLPCIFVCENNNYGLFPFTIFTQESPKNIYLLAMGTKSERASASTRYYTRGIDLPGIWVDGMDVLAVRSATEFAIDYVINNGPLVMETNTYRYYGHSMSDPGLSYRTREEIQEVRKNRDPITSFKKLSLELGLLTVDEMKAIDSKIRKKIDKAAAQAKLDSELPLCGLWTDVYAQNLEPKIRGTNEYNIDHIQKRKGENH